MARPRARVAVAACLAVGVALRVREYLRLRPFWYDESFLLANVAHASFGELLGPLPYNLVIPGLFLWLERACFLAFGMTEWGMRLPAFVAGLAALAVMVPLARRVVGGPLAWLPVAFAALSRHAVSHGAEVRPYTADLLFSALALWLTAAVLDGGRTRARATAALLAVAALGPWLSFPGAFGLAGAGGALLLAALQHGGRARRAAFAALALTAVGSAVAVWAVQARHLYYPGMHEHWGPRGWGGFPDHARPWSVALWPLTRAAAAAGYGTREMGVPLAALALCGVVALARRNAPLAAAVALPFAGALAASLLGLYPLAERTTTFLLPAIWVAAAAGLSALLARVPRRWPTVVLPLALLAPDIGNAGRDLLRPTPPDAREAFAHVRGSRAAGDALWFSHPWVYETYYGTGEKVFGPFDLPAAVVGAPRVWVIDYRAPTRSPADALADALRAAGYREAERRSFGRVVTVLYAR